MSGLKGHVHPIDVDVAEHAVGMTETVELIVPGTKTLVPLGGNVETLGMFADRELKKLTVVTADEEAGAVGAEEKSMPVNNTITSVSSSDRELEELIVVMNDSVLDTDRDGTNVPVPSGVVVFVVNGEGEKVAGGLL